MALHTSGSNIINSYGSVVYLRGIGRSGDLQSASGMWSAPGEPVFTWDQKWQPLSENIPRIDATFRSYRDYWHVNMIRLLIPVDWWWMDTVYPQDYQPTAPNNEPISYRNYIETVITRAAKYGIYVDLCPYSAVNTYLYSGSSEGEPGFWIPGTASYNFMQTVTVDAGKSESQFWKEWWTSVVKQLGRYANVIFEMWNEPGHEKEPFFNYMVESYSTIRDLKNQNLIFMQWHPGIVPDYHTLTWAPELYNQLKQSIGKDPVNLVFTTHPYRHSPYPNLQWAYSYSGVQSQLLNESMVPQTRNSNFTVPLLFNELGVLDSEVTYDYWQHPYEEFGEENLTVSERREREHLFWDAILRNAKELGIGVCVYYWMQDSAAQEYGYWGESIISSDIWTGPTPTPNYAGKVFINYGMNVFQTYFSRPYWSRILPTI